MNDIFENFAKKIKNLLNKKDQKFNETIKNCQKNYGISNEKDDLISISSETIDFKENNEDHNYYSESYKKLNENIINMNNSAILLLYFIVNVFSISIMGFLRYNVGTKQLPDYFSLYQSNIIFYEVSHILSILLGSLFVIIIYNILKKTTRSTNISSKFTYLDLLIFFGFTFNLFDFCHCLASLYSSKIS